MNDETLHIRPGRASDLPQITAIINHYIEHSPITFDMEPYTTRETWFQQFATTGRYRMLVAAAGDRVLGYANSSIFRKKAAYQTSVETTIYCDHRSTARGVGTALYEALFAALASEDLHRAYAGITMPNPASEALHERFGFERTGYFTQVGRKFDRYWDVAWFEKKLT